MNELTEAETTDSMGIMPKCTTKKQPSPRLESTAKDIPYKEILTAEKGTGTDGFFSGMNGTVIFNSGLRLPLAEQVSSETREEANDPFRSDDDTLPDDNKIPDNGAGELDNNSAVNKPMSHLQVESNMFTSSCELENTSEFSLGSEGIGTALAVFPLNNDGLIPPTAADVPQLPSSPENYQLGFKRKNPSPFEVRTDKIYRNIRARIDKTRGDVQFDDTCKKDTSQLLPPPSNVYNLDAIHENREFSRSGVSPHITRRDRWDGGFLCHPVLFDLSSVAKDEIKRVCDGVLRPDFAEFMAKHIPTLLLNGLSLMEAVQPKIDLFKISKDDSGRPILRYAPSSEREIRYLKTRLADIKLYLEYIAELARQEKSRRPDQTAKTSKTNAINIICGTSSMPKSVALKTRKRFHEHRSIGERWWRCGCLLGHGFFLLCSEKTGKKVLSLSSSYLVYPYD